MNQSHDDTRRHRDDDADTSRGLGQQVDHVAVPPVDPIEKPEFRTGAMTPEPVGAPTSSRDDRLEQLPSSPRDVRPRVWRFVARRTVRQFSDDQCPDLAAGLTYYAVLSLFPAVIALVSLLGVVGQGTRPVDALLDILREVGAGGVADTLQTPLQQAAQSRGAGVGLIVGIGTALWSASGYVGAFGRAMNRIYAIPEGRPFWTLRPAQLAVTSVVLVVVAVMAAGLVVSGSFATAIGSAIGLSDTVVMVFSIVKWPVLAAFAVIIVAILYYATPNIRQPRLRWMSVGAFVALVTWALASAALGFYVANVGSYGATYGSLAGVVIFLLWLWVTNLALLFGAELDAELQRGRELQAGLPAEDGLRLRVRDDRGLITRARRDRRDRSHAARVRAKVRPGSRADRSVPADRSASS
ncbi:MAG: YihY/virulence factor BrkB family protein [Angustibacter sp.]